MVDGQREATEQTLEDVLAAGNAVSMSVAVDTEDTTHIVAGHSQAVDDAPADCMRRAAVAAVHWSTADCTVVAGLKGLPFVDQVVGDMQANGFALVAVGCFALVVSSAKPPDLIAD
jgi:hypothetical protein